MGKLITVSHDRKVDSLLLVEKGISASSKEDKFYNTERIL